MKFIGKKTSLCLILMILFLLIAFMTNDVIIRQLFVSLGIILGAFSLKFVSNQTQEKNGEH
jgi:hypothetical protein